MKYIIFLLERPGYDSKAFDWPRSAGQIPCIGETIAIESSFYLVKNIQHRYTIGSKGELKPFEIKLTAAWIE